MALVNVTAQNTRVEDAETATGWTSIGGGAGGAAEPSFPYQGGNLYNRKITSNRGFYYDPTLDSGTSHDMTSTAKRVWMVKAVVTDPAGLTATNGLEISIGSGTAAFHKYVITGTNSPVAAFDEYTPRGGLFIIPIDPNVAAYRASTSGSPVLTAVDYFALEANFDSSTAKSENVGLDAIDLGTGLTLQGGDGADPDGVYQDFVDTDEGTVNNRWGYASSVFGAVSLFFGNMTIGGTSATVFNDSTGKILWLDGMFGAGWSKVTVDLQNAGTVVTDGSSHTGLGSTTTEDTRPDYEVTGTAGTFTFTGVLENFRNIILNSASTVTGGIIECSDLTQGDSVISDTVIRTDSATGVATIDDANFTNLTDTTFEQKGSGHVFEITTPGSYGFNNLKFSGYGADGTNSAVVYNNSGGAVTINVVNGGDGPTVRNGTGASTTVNNTVLVGITVLDANTLSPISGARVLIEAATGGSLPVGTDILSGTTDVNGRIEDAGFAFTSDQPVSGRVRRASGTPYYKTGQVTGSITSNGFDTNILLISDE